MADLTYTVDISTKKALSGLKGLQKQIKKTDSTFGKLGKSLAKGSFKVASGGLKSLAATAVVATAAFVAFGTKAINTLDDLEKASSKLGVSSRFLSSWQKVATQAGLTTQNFTIGLQRFLRRIGEAQIGAGTLLKPLKEMGISLRDANGNLKDGTVVFQEYINVLSNTESATTKLRLAFAAFDTEGVAMVNIAKMTSAEIAEIQRKAAEAGIVIDTKLVVAAAKAKDAFADLIDVGKGFGLQFFGALAPSLDQFSQDLRKKIMKAVAGAGGMEVFAHDIAAQFLGAMASFIESMAMIVDSLVNAFAVGTNSLKSIMVALSPLIPGEFSFGDIDGEKKKVQDAITDIQVGLDKFDAMPMWKRMLGGTVRSVMEQELSNLEDKLESINDGSIVMFEKMSLGGTTAADAVAGVTAKLRDQSKALEQAAQIKRDFNKSGVHRGETDPNIVVEPIVAETTVAAVKDILGPITHYNDAVLRHANALKAGEEERKNFELSFLSLRSRLLPLKEAQINYNKELRIMNRALKEGFLTETEHAKAIKNLKEAYEDFQAGMDPDKAKTWAEGWKEAFTDYADSARDAASNAKEYFGTATQGMEDAIVEFAKTGKMTFESLMADLTEQLLRSQIKNVFADILEGGGGIEDLKGVFNQFAGAFATGGYIPGGQFGLVGERGPELIGGPAQVTPMSGGTGAGNVTYNINAVDTNSFRNLLASDAGFIHGVVQQGAREFR
tara:strand:+ start:1961 stop:4135 length:2175 start_codon:yes stop_codon:yes gene_type:complete